MSRYIDADLIEYEPMCRARGNGMYADCEIAYKDQVDDIPTADVRENVPGKWWHEPNTNNTWIQRCSNCFQIAMITIEEECPYNYCPLCGADMRGGNHEKDN